MSGKLTVMAGLAVVFGTTSYYAGNQYLESQTQARLHQIGEQGPAVELASVVVAAKPMTFGDKVTAEHLKIVDWPKDARPEGAFASIEQAIGAGERKVIQSIEANEPVLKIKLTGENSRAGLAGIIADGMRAVTIPVDMVKGVGGFVMPGDRVDIVFAQLDRKTGEQTAKILMENIKVLSIDQEAGSRTDGPKIAKSVTLETDAAGAQKLALATNVGKLSLLLRGAGDNISVGASTVSFSEVIGKKPAPKKNAEPKSSGGILSFLGAGDENAGPRFTTIKVVRGDDARQTSVPVQSSIDPETGTRID